MSSITAEISAVCHWQNVTKKVQLENISVHQQTISPLDTDSIPVYLIARSEALELQKSCGTIVGKLNPHYSKLIRILLDGESIELQALLVPTPPRHTGPKQSRNRGRKLQPLQAKDPTLSLIFYGSMEMSETIGDFLSKCSEYLQPPMRCNRNVRYYNPQSLLGRDEEQKMTFELHGHLSLSKVETMAQSADPSAVLETKDSNPEIEASAAVKSSLYRYVSS